jgi:hypothetical protein
MEYKISEAALRAKVEARKLAREAISLSICPSCGGHLYIYYWYDHHVKCEDCKKVFIYVYPKDVQSII